MEDLTPESYQDAIQTLKATKEVCHRLEKWAMKELADPCLSLPLLDAVRYCEATIEQCSSYFVDKRPLLHSEFVQEQVWRGLGALGFDPDAEFIGNDNLVLNLLFSECKRRSREVLEQLVDRIAQISEGKSSRQNLPQTEIETSQISKFFTAVKAAHENIIAGNTSPYAEDRRRRTETEVGEKLLPQIFAFGKDLSAFVEGSHRSETSTENQYPEKAQVHEMMQRFLGLSVDWAECLRKITDPINVQSYKNRSDVPYKEVPGVPVGSGSFGIVYKAERKNTNTCTIAAVKQLNRIYSSSGRATVRKELSMLQRCNHPNIIKLLDAYQIDDNPNTFYLVMEPWAPYTLSTFLHQSDYQRQCDSPWFTPGGYRTERQVIRILRGLADGLAYLHDKSIKHKDLNPNNILLYDDEPRGIRPIIADLGISKIFKLGHPTDFNKSTYSYLAPEQVKCIGSTLRSDVWQLGCCFALILAVFRQGSAGRRQLWNSFENSDTDCSCNIALEATSFIETFKILCGHGSVSQLRAHWLTTAMLEIEPSLRFDIEEVKAELADL